MCSTCRFTRSSGRTSGSRCTLRAAAVVGARIRCRHRPSVLHALDEIGVGDERLSERGEVDQVVPYQLLGQLLSHTTGENDRSPVTGSERGKEPDIEDAGSCGTLIDEMHIGNVSSRQFGRQVQVCVGGLGVGRHVE